MKSNIPSRIFHSSRETPALGEVPEMYSCMGAQVHLHVAVKILDYANDNLDTGLKVSFERPVMFNFSAKCVAKEHLVPISMKVSLELNLYTNVHYI